MSYYLAVDVGGTRTRIACYPETGTEPVSTSRVRTHEGDDLALDRLINLIEIHWPDSSSVRGIGVAAPGPVDPYKGIVIEAPNIPQWYNLPLKQILEKHFRVPVKLGNDANLAALGEWKYGAGKYHRHLIYITVSTGIGGGVIVDDKLVLGVRGLASELGHVTIMQDGPVCSCGHRGHLEALASGPAITKWVTSKIKNGTDSILSDLTTLSAKDIADAALENDQLAQAGFARAGKFLGIAIVNFLHIFNPSLIIIGGGVSQSGSLFLNPLQQELKKRVFSPIYLDDLKVVTSQLGDDVGLLGALALLKINE